jgi:hypothetical protein
MKKILLSDVPVGKSFVFNHRMYCRAGWLSPKGYNTMDIPCIPIGVINDKSERHFYCYTSVEV